MNESTGFNSRVDEADTEMELSAQDLLALSDSPPIPGREARSPVQPSKLPPMPEASPNRYASFVPVCLSVVALVGTLSVAYMLTSSGHARLAASNAPLPLAPVNGAVAKPILDDQSVQYTDSLDQIDDQSVRYANPFDKSEVFEFPAGTTETEAREAVAALLMERAMSREKT